MLTTQRYKSFYSSISLLKQFKKKCLKCFPLHPDTFLGFIFGRKHSSAFCPTTFFPDRKRIEWYILAKRKQEEQLIKLLLPSLVWMSAMWLWTQLVKTWQLLLFSSDALPNSPQLVSICVLSSYFFRGPKTRDSTLGDESFHPLHYQTVNSH